MSLKVLEIGVDQYLGFLDKIHGKSRLDEFQIKSSGVPTPEIRIVRSSIMRDYEMRRVYNKYVFTDDCRGGGYVVRWTNEDGEVINISDQFNRFMSKTNNNTKEDIELVNEM